MFVRDLRHPPAKVWDALTNPAQLDEWAPFTSDRTLATVGDATLTMIDGDVAEDLPATVHRAEPPTLLERIPSDLRRKLHPAELFHEVLEHQWYLGEEHGHDVDLIDAVDDYVETVLRTRTDEHVILPLPTPPFPAPDE